MGFFDIFRKKKYDLYVNFPEGQKYLGKYLNGTKPDFSTFEKFGYTRSYIQNPKSTEKILIYDCIEKPDQIDFYIGNKLFSSSIYPAKVPEIPEIYGPDAHWSITEYLQNYQKSELQGISRNAQDHKEHIDAPTPNTSDYKVLEEIQHPKEKKVVYHYENGTVKHELFNDNSYSHNTFESTFTEIQGKVGYWDIQTDPENNIHYYEKHRPLKILIKVEGKSRSVDYPTDIGEPPEREGYAEAWSIIYPLFSDVETHPVYSPHLKIARFEYSDGKIESKIQDCKTPLVKPILPIESGYLLTWEIADENSRRIVYRIHRTPVKKPKAIYHFNSSEDLVYDLEPGIPIKQPKIENKAGMKGYWVCTKLSSGDSFYTEEYLPTTISFYDDHNRKKLYSSVYPEPIPIPPTIDGY